MSKESENIQIVTPSVTIESIGKVARGLYSFRKPAGYKDLSSPVGLHKITVSQALNAAQDLGIAQSSSRGVYTLTEAGEVFARLLGFGKEEDCRRLIAKQVMELTAWSEVVAFLELNRGTPRDPLDLVLHVEQRLGKRWKNRMRGKIALSYKSILEYANLVRVEDNMIVSLLPDETGRAPELLIESEPKSGINAISETQTRHHSIITRGSKLQEYYEFSLPDFFVVMVRKKISSIDYLRKQLKPDSMLNSWLDAIEEELGKEVVDQ